MRHSFARKPKPAYPRYRIRFKASKAMQVISGTEEVTAHPGIIKRNRPKADLYLAAVARFPDIDPWLERQDTEDGEWVRIT